MRTSIVEFIINILLEKKIIKLSSIENSFYIYKILDRDVKLNKDIINLNYSKESPYLLNKTSLSYINHKSKLYLWFIKGDYKQRYLPEAYIIFSKLIKRDKEIIFLISGDITKSIIIKDSNLISSFSKKNITNMDILLMKEQYGIDKVEYLSENEYKKYLYDSIKYLKINDLFNILNINIDFKKLSKNGIKFLSLPLFISSILIVSVVGSYSYYMENKADKLYVLYDISKKSNNDIKNHIRKNEDKNIIYKNIIQEFKYVDKTIALSKILNVTHSMDMTIFYIKIHNNSIDFIIKTKYNSKIPTFINKLFESNLFMDIKNINSRKLRDSMLEVTMSAKLKEIK